MPLDLAAQKFHKLTAIEAVIITTAKTRRRAWKCICECGTETIVVPEKLVSGHTKSCGCLRGDGSITAARTAPKPRKNCPNCGVQVTGHINRIYCSLDCRRAYAGEKFPSYSIAYRQDMRAKDPQRFLLYRVKNRAKSQGIVFDLREGDLIIPTHCPVLGVELIWNLGLGQRGYHPHSFSVDRLRAWEGYIPGNVRVISARANLLKSDATIEELELVLADLKKIRGHP